MAAKGKKSVISFILSAVLILNISVTVIYAIEETEGKREPKPFCSFFCNLNPSMAEKDGKITCPHHLRESKKKRLASHFQCKISTAKCHDNAPLSNASLSGDVCLLSKHSINQIITATFFDFYNSVFSSQLVISFLERPPSRYHS